MCNWFCRRSRDLEAFLDTGLGQLANAATGGYLGVASKVLSAAFDRLTDIPMTESEKLIIDKWLSEKFRPFITNVFARAVMLKDKNSFSETDLILINQLLKDICLANNYYLEVKEFGLSEPILQARREYIKEVLDGVLIIFNEYIARTGVVLEEFNNSFNYYTIPPMVDKIRTGTFSCFIYKVSSSSQSSGSEETGGNTIGTGPQSTGSNTTGETSTGTGSQSTGSNTTGETSTGTGSQSTGSNTTGETSTVVSTNAHNNNKNLPNLIIGIALVYGGYKLLKSEKNNQIIKKNEI